MSSGCGLDLDHDPCPEARHLLPEQATCPAIPRPRTRPRGNTRGAPPGERPLLRLAGPIRDGTSGDDQGWGLGLKIGLRCCCWALASRVPFSTAPGITTGSNHRQVANGSHPDGTRSGHTGPPQGRAPGTPLTPRPAERSSAGARPQVRRVPGPREARSTAVLALGSAQGRRCAELIDLRTEYPLATPSWPPRHKAQLDDSSLD